MMFAPARAEFAANSSIAQMSGPVSAKLPFVRRAKLSARHGWLTFGSWLPIRSPANKIVGQIAEII